MVKTARAIVIKDGLREKKNDNFLAKIVVFLAERKGFEPLKRYQRLHDFQSCALGQLSHLSVKR